MALFLLEIGTEDLPADFARLAIPQLEERVVADLLAARLAHRSVQVTSTPRRLVVLVDGLPQRQEDIQEEQKGPPAQQAFREGVPTAAAEGFARRCGLPVEQLEVRDTPRGPFVFARTIQSGRATVEVLAACIPGWIWGLQGRRFMRWGEGEARFSRPVRWLVALLDGEVVPVVLQGCDPPVQSDRLSRGHRLSPGPVSIATAASYAGTLAAVDVTVDRSARAATIREQLERAAASHGARLDLLADLFEELVDLVESPLVMEGEMDAPFLSLPPEVISTVMRAHQRYVPLLRLDAVPDPLALRAETVLLPRFLFVSNAHPDAAATVKLGNERVLRARLADAGFFLRADQGVACIDRREALDRVTFAEGLGSLRDRTERLEWCTDVLLEWLQLPEQVATAARRAAHLCKHDLVSQMVGEFPELQGVMGAKYLLAEGEHRDVALAVLEHYQPRGAGDALPSSQAGAVLALAERIELLLSIFSTGERPSGSSDPYGLRRAGNGVLQILWGQQWKLDLVSLCSRGGQRWQEWFAGLDGERLAAELQAHFHQRLQTLLEEEQCDPDIVRAVTASADGSSERRALGDVCDARLRCFLLQNLRTEGRLSPVQAVVQRAARLAQKGDLPATVLCPKGVIDPDLFVKQSEHELYGVIENLAPLAQSAKNYSALAASIESSAQTLAAFFDGPDSVMVLCEEKNLQANRLRLLSIFRNQAAVIANFENMES